MIKLCYIIVNCKITGPMKQTLNIVKNLDRKKFDIFLITLFDEEENNTMLNDYLSEINYHACLHLNRISSIIYGKYLLKKELCRIKPNIIHSLGMPPYRLSLYYRKADHIVTLRNYPYEDYPSYYNKFIGPVLAFMDIILIKKLIKKGKKFVTCSKSLSDIYAKKQSLKIDYIQNGVDIEKYPRKNKKNMEFYREKLNLPKDKMIVTYTAPFNNRKNQEFAIRGVLQSNIKNLVLVLCGSGGNYELLREKYKNYNQIIFTGKVSNVSEYLCCSDFYVSTSKSEGMPNSVLEAMSSGLGVLLSNIPQHMELFDFSKDIGFLYELNSIDDFISKLKTICKQDTIKMGNASYSVIIENLTSQIMANKYENLYLMMLEKGEKNV